MISAKALGVLCHLVYTGTKPTASALQETLGGGKYLLLAALKELVEEGLVERKNIHINGGLRQECKLTSRAELYIQGLGFPTPQTATWNQVSPPIDLQNQLINPNNITSITSKEVREENLANEYKTVNMSMEDNLPYDFFKSDPPKDDYVRDGEEENLKYRAAKMKEGKTEFKSKKSTRMGTRHNLAQELWGSNEVAFEFMERLTQHFHIKNNITIRLITGAFATMRKAQNTTALEELKMLDLFFATTKFEKYDDGEHMWKLFIYRASELAVQAKRMVQTEVKQETAAIQAAKSQEWLSE